MIGCAIGRRRDIEMRECSSPVSVVMKRKGDILGTAENKRKRERSTSRFLFLFKLFTLGWFRFVAVCLLPLFIFGGEGELVEQLGITNEQGLE